MYSANSSVANARRTPLWAERARAELGRTDLGRSQTELGRTDLGRSQTELTPTEQRVAELAASGKANREVAAELFVSPKTVEANLARVYRKLGIRSRAQLGRHLRP